MIKSQFDEKVIPFKTYLQQPYRSCTNIDENLSNFIFKKS